MNLAFTGVQFLKYVVLGVRIAGPSGHMGSSYCEMNVFHVNSNLSSTTTVLNTQTLPILDLLESV